MDAAWIVDLLASPWLFPALFALIVVDAFFVIVPSETAVVALAAVSGSTGSPSLWSLIAVASIGAIVGDSLCYLIGRLVGFDRWEWQQRGSRGAAIAAAKRAIHIRPAVLIFTARYIPFARIAVNLTAGAARLYYPRYLALSAGAGLGWALYNTLIGAFFGRVFESQPVLAIGVSIVVAITLGVTIDFVAGRIAQRRTNDEQ